MSSWRASIFLSPLHAQRAATSASGLKTEVYFDSGYLFVERCSTHCGVRWYGTQSSHILRDHWPLTSLTVMLVFLLLDLVLIPYRYPSCIVIVLLVVLVLVGMTSSKKPKAPSFQIGSRWNSVRLFLYASIDGDVHRADWLLYTVSQKKLCQLIFCSLSVKYEPISIKTGRIVPEETLNETVPKLPTSPKVCACTTLGNLKCQIEPSTR